jgi:hypothetical protein
MRKLFTIIIFGLVFSQLPAQQSTLAGNETPANPSTIIMRPTTSSNEVQESNAKSSSALESSSDALQARLYPNPAEDQVRLTANDKMIGNTIRIYSLLGSEVASRTISSSHESIDISSLQQGLYLYSIIDKNNKSVVTGKFNKQ